MATGIPRWQCRRVVEGFEIGKINWRDNGGAELVSTCGQFVVCVSQAYLDKYRPTPEGFYMKSEDGYESWSPADTFRSGHTQIED